MVFWFEYERLSHIKGTRVGAFYNANYRINDVLMVDDIQFIIGNVNR